MSLKQVFGDVKFSSEKCDRHFAFYFHKPNCYVTATRNMPSEYCNVRVGKKLFHMRFATFLQCNVNGAEQRSAVP